MGTVAKYSAVIKAIIHYPATNQSVSIVNLIADLSIDPTQILRLGFLSPAAQVTAELHTDDVSERGAEARIENARLHGGDLATAFGAPQAGPGFQDHGGSA